MQSPPRVAQMMTTDLVTVSPDATLIDAQQLFAKHRFHHLPVLEGGKLVGILSDRDILRAVSPFLDTLAERRQDLETVKRHVHTVMTRALVTVDAGANVSDAAVLMLDKGVSCLPVVAAKKLVGIITTRDMLRFIVRAAGEGAMQPDGAAADAAAEDALGEAHREEANPPRPSTNSRSPAPPPKARRP